MMSTQNQAGHGVIQSSIALLQERFKELQRVKEMREKKELITIFSDNNLINTPNIPNNYETPTSNNDGDVVDVDVDNDDDDDELQIFLPPNYYYTGRKPSCYSSSSSLSSSLLLSHNNNHNYHSSNNNNFNEISLSLWPSSAMSTYNHVSSTTSTTAVAAAAAAAAAEHFRRAKFEAPISTMSVSRTSSCVSSVYKFEDIHVSDVDTTLHL